jgi:hypothetical protein
MFARGIGGWLFDFGHLCPPYEAQRGWYDSPPLIAAIRPFAEIGERRARMEISSIAQVAAVYEPRAFFATEHWKAEEPYQGYGITVCDHFNHWFINSQQRTFSRMAAPFDSLYRFDLTPDDARKFRLLFMVNLFTLDRGQVDQLLAMVEGSGATVVWSYAPGYISPQRFDLQQMERLTGFTFSVLQDPGPMQIRLEHAAEDGETIFGTRKPQKPRFAVLDTDVAVLGRWVDNGQAAFARKQRSGWTSIYVGAGPITVHTLRRLATEAGVPLWSDRPDIVYAIRDAVTVIATSAGKRTLTFPAAMRAVEGGEASKTHALTMEFGEVRVFVTPGT